MLSPFARQVLMHLDILTEEEVPQTMGRLCCGASPQDTAYLMFESIVVIEALETFRKQLEGRLASAVEEKGAEEWQDMRYVGGWVKVPSEKAST